MNRGGVMLSDWGRIPHSIDRSGLSWLTIWFVLNVALSILNKSVFVFYKFKFPFTLSMTHMIITWVLSYVFIKMDWLWKEGGEGNSKKTDRSTATTPSPSSASPPPSSQELPLTSTSTESAGSSGSQTAPDDAAVNSKIRWFSVLFCFNIVFGNLSIHIVDLALSQVVRSSIPIFIMVLAYVIQGKKTTVNVILSVLPIIIGTSMACYGDVNFDGFAMVVLFIGCTAAALKVVLANKYLVHLKLHPVVMLYKVAPLASLQMLLMAVLFGEISGLIQTADRSQVYSWLVVLITGVTAFFLNFTNFMANKLTSALTVSITGQIKQATTILLSVWIFQTRPTMMNSVGITIAFFGGCLYTIAKLYEPTKSTHSSPMPSESNTASPIPTEHEEPSSNSTDDIESSGSKAERSKRNRI